MSADFWAGYVSGAAGIIIGNPLDLVKTRLQAGKLAPNADATSIALAPQSFRAHFENAGTLVRGASTPILGYGALNALLFVTYNRTLSLLTSSSPDPAFLYTKIWLAGATGGLASFVVSAPTELLKCRAQVSTEQTVSSWSIARNIWQRDGVRGLYYGGGITSVRDAVGYGFYFWSYEWMKHTMMTPEESDRDSALKVLLCGGLAGVVTWASIFPLDVIKTRVQTQKLYEDAPKVSERRALLQPDTRRARSGAIAIAKQAYRAEGAGVFFRGFGVCSLRAFIVNAVQWAVYEWMMRLLRSP